jgi:hypothetical protein
MTVRSPSPAVATYGYAMFYLLPMAVLTAIADAALGQLERSVSTVPPWIHALLVESNGVCLACRAQESGG